MMIFHLNLQSRVRQAAAIALAVICLGLLARTILVEFITGTLSDNRLTISPAILRAAVGFYPHSGRMFAALARLEENGGADDLARAEADATAAIANSPRDYQNFLLLASIEESRGDRSASERTLDEALRLAPNYSDVHWRMANLQLREGNLDAAIPHFQTAVELNPPLVYATLDLLWNTTNGTNIPALKKIVENSPREQISLARFLIKQDRIADALEILSAVDAKTALTSWETKPIIYELIAANRALSARDLWVNYRTPTDAPERDNLIWNGDFEGAHLPSFEHFEWHLSNNNFARVSVDDRESHSGANALRLDFLGRGSTRLDTEIKQQLAARAGTRYQVEFFVKTEDFHSPEELRVAVADQSGKWIVYSPPIADGSGDWRRVAFVFSAPRTSATGETTLLLTIKCEPKFNYEDPTRGRVWFDDFTMTEARGK